MRRESFLYALNIQLKKLHHFNFNCF